MRAPDFRPLWFVVGVVMLLSLLFGGCASVALQSAPACSEFDPCDGGVGDEGMAP